MTTLMLLDHVAIRVDDRAGMSADILDSLGWPALDTSDRLTLIGPDDNSGKITLLDTTTAPPNGARIRELHIINAPLEGCLSGIDVVSASMSTHGMSSGIVGAVIEVEHPQLAASLLIEMPGMVDREENTVQIGTQWLRFVPAEDHPARPPVDHIGIRVPTIDAISSWSSGIEHRIVRAPRSTAVFMPWYAGARIEYIEVHAPSHVAG